MDLITGWDFDKPEDRKAAERYQREEEPFVVVGSPMCAMFRQLQNLSKWTEAKQEKYENAVGHMEWSAGRCKEQVRTGRIFLHENPHGASS